MRCSCSQPIKHLLAQKLAQVLVTVLLWAQVAQGIPAQSDATVVVPDDHTFGVIIDAGSSGSRVRIYAWPPRKSPSALPVFREVHSLKKTPGISSYAGDLPGLREHVIPLIEEARRTVPSAKHAGTAIYLMATAGMRLLLEDKANTVIETLNEVFEDPTICPFHYQAHNTRILSGEEEGVFAWIAVNYLTGFFSDKPKVESTGILELGGASMQIAFIPEGSILADKFPVRIAGKTYPIYVHSYLYYGQNYVVKRIQERLNEQYPDSYFVANPCMLQGDAACTNTDDSQVIYKGTGDPDACLTLMDNFIYKPEDRFCYPRPCAIGTVYQPTIPKTKEFYALSAFVFPPQRVEAVDQHGSFTPQGLLEKAMDFCKMNLSEVMEEDSEGKFISTECTVALFMAKLFTKGYGFADDTTQIKTKRKIEGHKIEWPLGAIIYELERRGCPMEGRPELREVKDTGASLHPSWGQHWIILIISMYCLNIQQFVMDSL